MIYDNTILWQAFVWLIFGYLVAVTLHTLIAVPRRLIESM